MLCYITEQHFFSLCNSGGSLREAPNAFQNQSFQWRMRILSLSQQRPPAVACGSTPVTSALPFQPPPPSTLLAGSSTWCTTIPQRHGEKIDLKAVCSNWFVLLFYLCKIPEVRSVISWVVLALKARFYIHFPPHNSTAQMGKWLYNWCVDTVHLKQILYLFHTCKIKELAAQKENVYIAYWGQCGLTVFHAALSYSFICTLCCSV